MNDFALLLNADSSSLKFGIFQRAHDRIWRVGENSVETRRRICDASA